MKIKLIKSSGFLAVCLLCFLAGNVHAKILNHANNYSLFYFQDSTANQGVTISGTITDEQNLPLPGVTVKVKARGAITDLNGKYTIKADAATDQITFSFIGYTTQTIAAGQSRTLNIKMLPAQGKALNEVVVIGYGTQRREQVTAAVATVKAEDFNQGGTRSPLDLIQGKVAGLNITRSGGNNPNSSAAIQLRGIGSLSGSSSPLIVIDGVPGGNLDLLQQDDIESFDVLKDGSAAAIYGTRGNAGVILITTKKGKSGESRYDYSTYFQRESVAKRPQVLSAEQFISVAGENNNLGGNTDMYNELIDKNNLSQYHNFAASGGSDNSNYRASLYFNDAKGIAKQNERRQYGGRINFNQKGLKGKLSLQTNLAVNLNKANLNGGRPSSDLNNPDVIFITPDFEQAIQRNPTAPIRNPDGTFLQTDAFNNYNPLARLEQEIYERDQQVFSGDAKFTLEPVKDLKISAFGALIRDSYNDREYRDRESYSSIQNYQGTGFASKFNRLRNTYTFESTADYTKRFGENHSISAVGGYSYQYFSDENFSLNNSGFITDVFEDYNIGTGIYLTEGRANMGSRREDNILIAFFGRVNYAYKDKYLAQIVYRREGSSRFGANNKWGDFPAASIGWNINKEDFMQNVSFINNLKLRAGFGVTGNQGIPNYQSQITLSTGGAYLQDGSYFQTYGPGRNPNPDLRWEKKNEFNAGIDFSLFDNRIGGSIDVYNRKTTDLLLNYNAQVPPFISPLIFTNVGSVKNSGLEIALNANPVRGKKVNWNLDLAFSTNKNELTSLSNDVFKATFLEFYGLPSPGNLGFAIRAEEGGALGNFYGYRFAGLTPEGRWQFFKADGSIGQAGDMTNEDKTVIGNGVPKYYLSWNNRVAYKNFDLTVFFRSKFGYEILNTQEIYFGNRAWLPNNVLESAINKNGALRDSPQYSDYYLENGAFVKLDNVTLAYNFKFKSSYIRNLRVFVTGRNIATITGYSGLDPEVQDTGLETGIDTRGFYPRTESYSIGLNMGF